MIINDEYGREEKKFNHSQFCPTFLLQFIYGETLFVGRSDEEHKKIWKKK